MIDQIAVSFLDGGWWSWLLTGVGVFGGWKAGSGYWQGWAIGLGAQFLWLGYAVVQHQYGFVPGAFFYGFMYWRNLRRWRRQMQNVIRTEASLDKMVHGVEVSK